MTLRDPPLDPGRVNLHRPGPPTLVGPLWCDQGPAWSIEAELKRQLACVAAEKCLRFDALGTPHAEEAPDAARYPGTHDVVEQDGLLQHGPAAIAGKVLAYLVQRWRLAHLEQELAEAEHSLLGRGLLCRDQLPLLCSAPLICSMTAAPLSPPAALISSQVTCPATEGNQRVL